MQKLISIFFFQSEIYPYLVSLKNEKLLILMTVSMPSNGFPSFLPEEESGRRIDSVLLQCPPTSFLHFYGPPLEAAIFKASQANFCRILSDNLNFRHFSSIFVSFQKLYPMLYHLAFTFLIIINITTLKINSILSFFSNISTFHL